MMKTQLLIAVAAVGLITTALKAQADDPVWGPGGYANSLSRVQAKGMAAEQRAATLEANWLQANEGHIKKLLEWLRSNNKLRD
jgi:hypothetical protein